MATRQSSDRDEFAEADPEANTITVDGLDAVPAAEVAPGHVLAGRFQIIDRLGEGGTGAVYAARDELLGEEVALKVLHGNAADPVALGRLRDEVRAARRIAHPNVCRVHDLCVTGEGTDRRVFVVMELLRGETLRRRLRRGVPAGEGLEIVRQLGAGLSAAHRAGVVHCDVKPENTLLIPGGRAVLTDFGIARIVHAGTPGAGPGHVEGTPAYMSPEQLRGLPLDERTDVYALATVAFELLVGRHPLGVSGSFEEFSERLAKVRPEVRAGELAVVALESRGGVGAALVKGMAKEPADRHESVDALVADLVTSFRFGARTPEVAPAGEVAREDSRSRPSGKAATTGPVTRARTTGNRGSRRIATVVHVLVDSVGGANLDEEAVADRAEAVVAAAQQILGDAGGTIVSRAHGAVVAVFGAVTSAGDEPVRAAEAARALASIGGHGVGVRAGIDTGRLLVKAGRPGSTGAKLSVSGEPLTRAGTLALAAPAGQVVVSSRTARLVGRRFRLEERGDGLRLAERRQGAMARPGTPLLGRDAELTLLVDRLGAAVRTGKARGALVLGPPGIGKSRLCLEVADVLDASGAFRVAQVSAQADDLVTPHAVLRALLGQLLELGERPASEDVAAACQRQVGEDLDTQVPVAIGSMYAAQNTAVDGAAVATAARSLLVGAARHKPLLLVVDDGHLADDASLDLLEGLGKGDLEVPIAVLIGGRPELVSRRPRATAALGEPLVLGPLDVAAARELAQLVAPQSITPAAIEALVETAEGNPFFLEELARDAQERGGAAPVSPTVEEAIQARLDRLAPDSREVLRAAALLGRTFRRIDLVHVAGAALELPEAAVDGSLTELEERGLVVALPPDALADDRYQLSHALVQDVAYRELTQTARRALHGAAARLYQVDIDTERGQVSAEEVRLSRLAELARHLEGADDTAGALDAYRRAGAAAEAQGAPADAYRCYSRARVLAGEAPDDALLLGLGASALDSGKAAEAEAVLDQLIARAEGKLLARALLVRGNLAKEKGRWQESVALLERGLSVVGDDRVLEAGLRTTLGWVLGYMLGDNVRGLAECTRAVEMLEGTRHVLELGRAYSALGASHMRAGRWRDQLRCNRRHLELGEQMGRLELRARAHLNLGVNLYSIGESDESVHHSTQSILLYQRLAVPASVALARNNLAFALVDLGRLDEAARELDEAFRLADLCGGLYFLFESEILRGRIAAKRGDLTEAAARMQAAIGRCQDLGGGTVDEGISWKYLGVIRSLAGDHDGAETAFARAAELLVTGDRSELARVQAERGRAAARRGDRETARKLWDGVRPELEQFPALLDLAKLEDVAWI